MREVGEVELSKVGLHSAAVTLQPFVVAYSSEEFVVAYSYEESVVAYSPEELRVLHKTIVSWM